jgi:exosortase
MSKVGLAEVLIGFISVLLIYNQVIGWMVQNWILNPYLNYGLLVPFISAYLIWRERESFKVSIDRRGVLLLVPALILYLSLSFTLKAISLVAFISGSFLLLFGEKSFRKILFPLAFLLLMVPVPAYMIEYIGLHLRTVSVNTAVGMADIFYDIQLVDDTYIKAGDLTLYVGLPCSGIESFLGFGVFALLFAYLFERGWKRAGLVTVCLGLTIAMNIMRIFLVIVVGISFGEAAALGVFHTLSGMVLISIYTVILLFVYRRRL